jgi:hypothetical protein
MVGEVGQSIEDFVVTPTFDRWATEPTMLEEVKESCPSEDKNEFLSLVGFTLDSERLVLILELEALEDCDLQCSVINR